MKRHKKRLLLSSILFGSLFNLACQFYWGNWLDLKLPDLIILETIALGYVMSVLVSFTDMFFRHHRNLGIWAINVFQMTITFFLLQ
jgi:hypothetical protein